MSLRKLASQQARHEDAKSKANHTPGPWKLSQSGRVVQSLSDDRWIADCLGYVLDNRVEQESNARLIAAAPELLEAAIRVLRSPVRWTSQTTQSLSELMAAVAKAEGTL